MYISRPWLVKHVLSDSSKLKMHQPIGRRMDFEYVSSRHTLSREIGFELLLHWAAESFVKLKRKFLGYISVDVVMKTFQSIIIWPDGSF
jgi:hypothetical protein